MHRNQVPQLIAGGNISPSTFVKVSTAANKTCLAAGANEQPIGISQVGAKDPPGLTGASTYAAVSGDTVQLFGLGDICLLKIGSGGVTRGDQIKSDANGAGVTAASTGTTVQWVGAIALESASADEFALVQVVNYAYRPALS